MRYEALNVIRGIRLAQELTKMGIDQATPKAATLFRIYNNNNDLLAFMMKKGLGLAVTIMDGEREYLFQSDYRNITKNELMHLAVVWSSDGKGISSDESTIRMYINGDLHYKALNYTWSPSSVKGTQFIVGGKASGRTAGSISEIGASPSSTLYQAGVDSSSVWGVIENLKVYNYAKIDFEDRNLGEFSSTLLSPSQFVEISDDGSTFYGRGSPNLPIVLSQVPSGGTRTIYLRTVVPRLGLTGKENRTSFIKTSLAVNV